MFPASLAHIRLLTALNVCHENINPFTVSQNLALQQKTMFVSNHKT